MVILVVVMVAMDWSWWWLDGDSGGGGGDCDGNGAVIFIQLYHTTQNNVNTNTICKLILSRSSVFCIDRFYLIFLRTDFDSMLIWGSITCVYVSVT